MYNVFYMRIIESIYGVLGVKVYFVQLINITALLDK